MLSKERLIAIYEEWPDEKLKAEYANEEDYEPVAIEAMKTVMLARGLSVEKKEIPIAYQDMMLPKGELDSEERHYTQDSNQKFATSQKDKSGTYFQKTMMLGSKSNLLGCTIAMAIIGVVFVVIFLISEMVEPWVNGLIVVGIIGFVAWSVIVLKNNKTEFRLFEQGGKPKIEISLKNELIQIAPPFNYSCYAQLVEHYYKGVRIKRPNLYLLIELPDERVLMLHEDQSALKTMPYDWHDIGQDLSIIRSDLRLTQHGTTPIELKKLRRILDGLTNGG